MNKKRLNGLQLASAADISANYTSSFVDVLSFDNVGVWFTTTGVTDNTGTLTPWIRAYRDANTYGPWVALTLSTPVVLTDSDASTFINLNQLPPCQLKLEFVAAGGTPDGTAEIWVSGTEI